MNDSERSCLNDPELGRTFVNLGELVHEGFERSWTMFTKDVLNERYCNWMKPKWRENCAFWLNFFFQFLILKHEKKKFLGKFKAKFYDLLSLKIPYFPAIFVHTREGYYT